MTWATFGRRKEVVAGVFLLAVTLSWVVTLPGLVPFLRSGYQNFTIFYAAAKMVRSGQAATLYDLPAQYRVQRQIAPDVRIRQAALPYNHPPFEALVFVPLTFLPYWPAFLVWTALNLGLVAASLALLRKQFDVIRTLSSAFLTLAAAGFFPIVSSMIQGHDCVLLVFLYVLALAAFERNQNALSGSLLAMGLFRPQIVLPLAVIVAVRRPRLLLGFVPVAAALAAVSVAMVGWDGAFDYVRVVLDLEKSGAGGSIVSAGMPNLRGIIAGVPGIGGSWTAILTAASSIAVAAIAMLRSHFREDSPRFSFALATLVSLLVSYHALTYDLTLLFPAVLLLFATPGRTYRMDQADIELLVLLFLIPRFELLGPSVSTLVWFGLLLFWFFRKRGLGQPDASTRPMPDQVFLTP